MPSIRFDKWFPDADPKVTALVVANNTIPYKGRFYSLNQPEIAVSEQIGGGAAAPLNLFTFLDSSGSNKIFVGAQHKFYRLDGTWTDITNTNGWDIGSISNWDYTLYGDTLLVASRAIVPQALLGFSSAANFTNLSASCPKAATICVYHDHLFLGNVEESATTYPRRLWRSAKGDLDDFTPSSATGCGYRDLPDWGSSIVALRQLGDFLVVYMTNSIWLVHEVGPPIWFSYDQLSSQIGALSLHSVIPLSNNTHVFLGQDDIYILRGGSITSIGSGVRGYFFEDLDTVNVWKITHFVDHTNKYIGWAYPSRQGGGLLDRLLIYNYEEERFSTADISARCVGNVITGGYPIDSLDENSGLGTFDELPLYPFDSSFWVGQSKGIGLIDMGCYLNTLSGDPKSSTFVYGEIDFDAVGMMTEVRPIIHRPVDASTGVTCEVYFRMTDAEEYGIYRSAMRPNGLCDVRCSGRYMKLGLTISGRNNGVTGFKYDAKVMSSR